ncbi:unnamed protein product, partial [marine sediment metagenome]
QLKITYYYVDNVYFINFGIKYVQHIANKKVFNPDIKK